MEIGQMATFHFKVNDKKVELDAISDETLSKAFSDVRHTILEQIQTLECHQHHNEPAIFLRSEGQMVQLEGIAACCSEFLAKVQGALNLPPEIISTEATTTTRVLRYTEHG
jgi:hypothetical protein